MFSWLEKERDIKLGGKTAKKGKKFKNNGNRDSSKRREELSQ